MVKHELQNLIIKINNQLSNSELINVILELNNKLLFQCNVLLYSTHEFVKK